ncbi:inosine monophosphate dehydrogenase [Dothidotthia symphoricarpi CBS 119687]|uniref:Inosine monophosphate dehydrogenase n=1 Tax=Dothidotthia symphoricarpi CBS 119687 TaxID=1392245 RepID=A0A6A5ZY54_9PLEO|nr:inosine monophosphate dehydrogenase [Dothidotthia symphoricarpi CBS 119687]KAF2124216.1 inosine monophosphate dehydrogenase [Dothidotthia symphoricarpi CBS 119687]
MPIKTWLSEKLGIRIPLVQGGMMWVGRAELISAVANAGCLGFLTALTQPTPEALRLEIRKTKSLLKPSAVQFGVNITLLPSMNAPDYAAYARVVVEEGIKIVETAGDPTPVLKYLKDNGVTVFHKCVTLKHALRAEKLGVDCISIDGIECAGHGGEYDTTSLMLLSLCAEQLKIPYLASGGFANGRQLAAALALGAVGVNMGTRWMCTVESPIHQNVKDAIVKATENDTVLVLRKFRNTTRLHKNVVSMEVHQIENTKEDVKFEHVAHLMSGQRGKEVYATGDVDAGVWSLGMCAGLIHDVPTCEELAKTMERDAIEVLTQGNALVVESAKL